MSPTRFERPQHCQPARINRIDHLFDLQKVARENFPAMPQGRRRFQRPIISGIVEPRNLECIVDLVLPEIAPPGVIAMTEDKASLKTARFPVVRSAKLSPPPALGAAAGIPSPKSAPDDPGDPFEKIAIRFAEGVDLRAFHVNHPQNAIVFIIDNGHDHL